jgi:5,10-methylene-tetrahydrofolate dehydrogenase/methenyl tetrahydrofolate cyclohydrolase
MKFIVSLFILLATSSLIYSAPPQKKIEEVTLLEDLIEISKKNLEEEQKLLQSLNFFNEIKIAFVEKPTSGRLASQLVRAAMSLNKEVEKSQLAYLFTKELQEEIAFYCKVGVEAKK